jgi:glycosyltransferase involved in cell wall biosynthesis
MSVPIISVIICSHNPRADYLQRTLQALQQQTLPMTAWELLLVDNGSESPLSQTINLSWHGAARHLHEPRLGLTFARLRGIRAAAGKTLVFLDDDNIADPNYLEQVVRIGESHFWLGAWGGQITPEFESTPPDWTRPYWCYLALRDIERDVWSNRLDFASAPCGAGLCVRMNVAVAYAESVDKNPLRQMLDRRGTKLNSGGDSDLAFTACDLGKGVGLFKELRLKHLIPPSRLKPEYLANLLEGISYSTIVVEFVHGKAPKEPPKSFARRLFEWYLRRRMNPRERLLHDAYEKGRRTAVEELAGRAVPLSQLHKEEGVF